MTECYPQGYDTKQIPSRQPGRACFLRQYVSYNRYLFRKAHTPAESLINARYLHTAVGVQQFPPGVSNNSLRIHCAVNPIAKPLLIARTA